MPDNGRRKTEQTQANANPQAAPSQPVGNSVPALKEGTETKVIYYQPQEDESVPKRRFTRWLYYRSQIILSALTIGVLIIYAAQLYETGRTQALEYRAYVAIRSVRLEQQPMNPTVSDVVITFANTGRTPGLNGKVLISSDFRATPIPEDAAFSPADHPPSKIVLAPQIDVETRPVSVPNLLGEITERQKAAEEAAKISNSANPSPSPNAHHPTPTPSPIAIPIPTPDPNQTKSFYVWGRIDYQDIFGEPHFTKFCFFNTLGTGTWNHCPTFNEFN